MRIQKKLLDLKSLQASNPLTFDGFDTKEQMEDLANANISNVKQCFEIHKI